jgi:hypothetical protein
MQYGKKQEHRGGVEEKMAFLRNSPNPASCIRCTEGLSCEDSGAIQKIAARFSADQSELGPNDPPATYLGNKQWRFGDRTSSLIAFFTSVTKRRMKA